MPGRVVRISLLLLGLLCLAVDLVWSQELAWRLPDLRLRDPAEREHALVTLTRTGGLVLLVTAPTVAQGEAQRAWAERLAAARPADTRARYALVEDLDQSWFPGRARSALRDAHDAEHDPLLLLDETGAARRALGVDTGVTWLLAYDRSGELRFVERGRASASRAERAWEAAALAPATRDAEGRAPR